MFLTNFSKLRYLAQKANKNFFIFSKVQIKRLSSLFFDFQTFTNLKKKRNGNFNKVQLYVFNKFCQIKISGSES